MDTEQLRKLSYYMDQLEQKVMVKCATENVLTRSIIVSTKKPKLLKTDFGEFIGEAFKFPKILTFNYYGLMKVSTGFKKEVEKLRNSGFDIKGVESNVVYFASLKLKVINEYAPSLISGFSEFKDYLVSIRNFPTNQK